MGLVPLDVRGARDVDLEGRRQFLTNHARDRPHTPGRLVPLPVPRAVLDRVAGQGVEHEALRSGTDVSSVALLVIVAVAPFLPVGRSSQKARRRRELAGTPGRGAHAQPAKAARTARADVRLGKGSTYARALPFTQLRLHSARRRATFGCSTSIPARSRATMRALSSMLMIRPSCSSGVSGLFPIVHRPRKCLPQARNLNHLDIHPAILLCRFHISLRQPRLLASFSPTDSVGSSSAAPTAIGMPDHLGRTRSAWTTPATALAKSSCSPGE